MASRALTAEESAEITQHQVAVDVIAIAAHISNPVEDLTLEQLQGIYQGRVTNWKDVGGLDAPITVVVRGKNSGTRGAFDKIVLDKQNPNAPNLQEAITAGDMAAIIGNDPSAIGYVGFGNLEPDIKVLCVDGVPPSEETARSGSYRLVRPLLFLTGPLTQPLGQTFVEFALSEEGQEHVAASGWVTAKLYVPPVRAERVRRPRPTPPCCSTHST